MASSYLPVADADRVNWLNNFKTQLITHGPSLGFTAAEITSVQNDAAMFQYIVQIKESCRQSLQQLSTLTKDLKSASALTPMGAIPSLPVAGTPPASVANGIFTRVGVAVKRIKLHPNYTATLGQAFDIIAPPNIFDPATAKPVLKITVEAGYPRIRWSRGQADGIYLYVDRRDNNGYVLIDKLVRTVYIDTAALPANTYSVTWDYKARFMIDDDEIGLFSDAETVNIVRV